MRFWYLSVVTLYLLSCKREDPAPTSPEMYFPSDSEWATTEPAVLNWNSDKLEELLDFMETNNTRAFLILQNGRIVVEAYWGQNLLQTGTFTPSSNWYWASAGKSLTALLVGLAQQDGHLSIENSTSTYLGNGWSNMPYNQETAITIRHQLTMTTGLDYQVSDIDCTDPDCLSFSSVPGTQWYYHNAPYTLLESVVSSAVGMTYNDYTDLLEKRIGMKGQWIQSGYNNVYYSTPRDAARFGLLILNNGEWNNEVIFSDHTYFNQMTNSSQQLNPSYGYLWWLNGKSSAVFPGSSASLNTSTTPDGPASLISALGKNGQFIDILPEKKLVIVRMGDSPDGSLVPITLHNEMWEILNDVIPQ